MKPRASYLRWVLACAVAETIGMTASAVAARLGNDVADGSRWLALAVVVAGGLVEGVALGTLQARVLADRWPSVPKAPFVLATLVLAGLGWAAASAPAVLGGHDDTGGGPPLGLIVLGALGIGLVMGPLLGAAQAAWLRGVVTHPGRWVLANTAAWPGAMAVIFVGASTAGAEWSTPVVAGYGAITGALAGSALGVVSGAWLGSLDGQPVGNRLILELVTRQWLGMHDRVIGLAVRGRRTRRLLSFPVQYAVHGDALVVVPGRADRKRWWRNLAGSATPVAVLDDGTSWHPASAEVLLPGAPGYGDALAAYRRRWPRFDPPEDQPVVVIRSEASGIPAVSRGLESVGW